MKLWLTAILLAGAVLRLAALDQIPPGLNQDEAINAWDAWCLLHTGRDHAGQAWPVFYTRALGENRTTLLVYLLLPFQAVGGLNVWTLRLPAALAGVATIALTCWIAARLFDRPAGLAAAALLAFMPWHIQLSRWGHEGCLTALLSALPVAALLAARLPPLANSELPRPGRAWLAGLLSGLVCYGYPAVRIFVPVCLVALAAAGAGGLVRAARTRPGRRAMAAFLLGWGLTFGPLVWAHVRDWSAIVRRGEATWVWDAGDRFWTRAAKVLARYPGHFGPDFLFQTGDHYEVAWAAGFGVLYGFMLPLLVVGAIVLLGRVKSSVAARWLIVWLAVYPAGDLLSRHMSMHVLRGAPGAVPLAVMSGLGLVAAARRLRATRMQGVCCAVAAALGLAAVEQGGRFLYHYFAVRPREGPVRQAQHADFVAACRWLRPRLHEYDAVALTVQDTTLVWPVTLVSLGFEPHAWFAGPREFVTRGEWDVCERYGSVWFLEPQVRERLVAQLSGNGRPDRVLFVVRPEEAGGESVVMRFGDSGGVATLVAYEAEL